LHLPTEELFVISILLEQEEENIQDSEKIKPNRFSVIKYVIKGRQ
jgi:hypothetical protein